MHLASPRTTTLTRRSLLAGSAGAALMALTGCAASTSGSSEVGLRFYEQKQEVIAYFDKLLRRFESQNAGISVVHDSTTSIAPQFVRGQPADVGLFNDNLELARYIKRGVLSDLSGLPSASTIRSDIADLTDQYAAFPGRTSVLPYSLAAAGVIYNKSIFAKHDLPVPTTWSEFVDVCTVLQKAGMTPIYATDRDTWTLWQGIFDYSVGSLVDTGTFFRRMKELGRDVGRSGTVSFEKTLALPMERAKKIASFFNPDHAVRAYADGNLAFGSGRAAMYLQGPWALSQIAVIDPKLDIGTFPLPVSEVAGERQVRVNIDLGLFIPEETRHLPDARRLVDFLMQPDVINAYNKDNLAYSTLEGAPPQLDPRVAELQTYVDRAAFYQGAGTFIPTSIPLGNYLQSAIGTGDFAGMLRQLDDDWRRLATRGALV